MPKLIPISAPSVTQKEIDFTLDAVRSGWVSSLGEYITRFEEEFADFCGTSYALTTSNGTSALHLALVSAGIGEGDEVIIPDFTFVATANAVSYTGAKPVMVDIDPESLCMDPGRISEAVTAKTKAIMPVHIFGHPADMNSINVVAREHGLFVIEDAAEAHGAQIDNRKVGSLGDCAAFSFYGNKIITTGEGGMITTNDGEFYQKARQLRDHSMDKVKRYWHNEIGYNYRITNLQAALGVAQLGRIDEFIARKKDIFECYLKRLSGVARLSLNKTAPWAKNVYWMVCAQIEGIDEATRERIMALLLQQGVDSRPYFYPISDLPMYRINPSLTPVTHRLYSEGICLPSFFDITEENIDYVCNVLRSVLASV